MKLCVSQKRSFSAGDHLLIVNKGPAETNLVAGQDVTVGANNQARGAGPHKYWNPSNGNSASNHYLDIPDYNGGDYPPDPTNWWRLGQLRIT